MRENVCSIMAPSIASEYDAVATSPPPVHATTTSMDPPATSGKSRLFPSDAVPFSIVRKPCGWPDTFSRSPDAPAAGFA